MPRKVEPWWGGCGWLSGLGCSSAGSVGTEPSWGTVSKACGLWSESWPINAKPFQCCQYRPLRVLPEEPESTTTRLAARRIGGGSCCGEVGLGDAVEIRKAA